MMTKQELRTYYLERRRALSPGELEEASELICYNLFSNYQLEKKKISLFLPIENKREINTYKILEKAISFDAHVALPRTNIETLEIKHILFESIDQLETSSYGIPEPKKGKVIAAEHFDFVFVPLLAVDVNGNRIGYGKGIYDRFLKKCSPRCRIIGLSHFDELIEPISEVHKDDIALHACITPNNVYRFE